jgi:hypothetical protein
MAGAWSARVIVGRPDAERLAIAAEIRALQRYILPDEPELPRVRRLTGNIFEEAATYARYHERQRLRALLTAEAKRAEKGE